MQFAHPFFLIFLSTLVIPVLIHLFNFRRFKKLYFTNVDFLEYIQQETRKQSKLRQLLILLTRLLALAMLILAFAKPFIPRSETIREKFDHHTVCIYVDNSFSMEAIATEGRLIDIAKARAREIAGVYSPSDLFMLLTNDFEGRHQRLISRDEFLRNLEEIPVSPATRSLPEIVSRINEISHFRSNDNHDAYLISDFQKSTRSLNQIRLDSLINWYLLQLTAEKNNNLYIDSLYFQSPLHRPFQPVRLHVRIVNSSMESFEKIPVKLTINNTQKALAAVSIRGGASTEIVMPYTENNFGIQYGIVEIPDYPITYDDKYYFSYEIARHIHLIVIYDRAPNKFLQALFQDDSAIYMSALNFKQLDFSKLRSASSVIIDGIPELSSGLSQELSRFIHSGGTLILFPPDNKQIQTYNDFLQTFGTAGYGTIVMNRERVLNLNLNNEIFRDIFEKKENQQLEMPDNPDLPEVMKYYRMGESESHGNQEILMGLENKDPFLTLIRSGRGKIYRFQVPLDEQWSDFPRHLIFVPSIYNMVLMSVPESKLWYLTGINQIIELSPDTLYDPESVHLKSLQSDFEVIPEINRLGPTAFIQTHEQIKIPGHFMVMDNNRVISGISFNISRKESDLTCLTKSELNDQITKIKDADIRLVPNKSHTLAKEIKSIKEGTPLGKWFVLGSLMFLLAEIMLLRFFPFSPHKNASPGSKKL